MFLANRIVEFVEAQKRNKPLEFASQQRMHGQQFSHDIELVKAFYNVTSGVAHIAEIMKGSQKFELDTRVMDAVGKMCNRLTYSKLQEAFDFVRLPFHKVWIEWPEVIGTQTRFAWLFEKVGKDNDNSNRGILVRNITMRSELGDVPIRTLLTPSVIAEDGFFAPANNNELVRLQDHEGEYDIDMTKLAASVLLLMNSRSRVLKMEDSLVSDKEARTRFKRSKISRSHLSSMRPITFDVSRILEKGHASTEEEARELQYISIRMGHFKVRKTGVFWWSPHEFKVTAPAEENSGKEQTESPVDVPFVERERRVVSKRQASEYLTPDGGHQFNI